MLVEKTVNAVFSSLKNKKFPINDEIQTQILMENFFKTNPELQNEIVTRSYKLSNQDIVDFYFSNSKLAIEVKVKGQATAILRQCERYCNHESVSGLILVTAFFIGFPKEINGKPCWFYHLSKNLL